MNEIRLLEDSIINQIAAGEVVERPASVVKELVENALDSGATQLTIEIKGGGTSYIRVSDNGRGIPRDNVDMAFVRHATSKIRSPKDLESVLSLGFRGEALASVAAVSQVEMTTMTRDDDTASYIRIEGGCITKRSDKGGTIGTTLVVRNLFFNTPARRKFLKSTRAECAQVQEIATMFALGRPDIAITFINNGSTEFQTKGSDLRTAILQVMGLHHAKNLVDVDFQRDGLYVTGVVGRPDIARGNRGHEIFFINGRYIRNTLLSHAVEAAYRTRLPTGRFPFCVLSLHLPPQEVDVNVHPTKMEVRFSDEARIRAYVEEAAGEALRKESMIPRVGLEKGRNQEEAHGRAPDLFAGGRGEHQEQLVVQEPEETIGVEELESDELEDDAFDVAFMLADDDELPMEIRDMAAAMSKKSKNRNRTMHFYEAANISRGGTGIHKSSVLPGVMEYHGEVSAFGMEKGKASPPEPSTDYRIIGQFFGTYWMIEKQGSLFFIDQHAAHERVLYDELMGAHRDGKRIFSQILIEPFVVRLNPAEEERLGEVYDYFTRLGFDIESFGEGSYGVRGIPQSMPSGLGVAFFTDILARLEEAGTPENATADERTRSIAMMACKAAVKANDHMSERECHALIRKMLSLPNPYTCPHGRPTAIEITKSEIQRKFKRT